MEERWRWWILQFHPPRDLGNEYIRVDLYMYRINRMGNNLFPCIDKLHFYFFFLILHIKVQVVRRHADTYSEITAAAMGQTSVIWQPFCSRLVKFVANDTGNLFTLPAAVKRTSMWWYILPALHTIVTQLWEIPSIPDGRTHSPVGKLVVSTPASY